jgi:hypothetical protein
VGGLACAPLGDGVSEVNDSRFRELVHQEFSSKQNRSAPLMSHGAVVFGIVCKMFENKKGFFSFLDELASNGPTLKSHFFLTKSLLNLVNQESILSFIFTMTKYISNAAKIYINLN